MACMPRRRRTLSSAASALLSLAWPPGPACRGVGLLRTAGGDGRGASTPFLSASHPSAKASKAAVAAT
eukprot:5382724-Lingulodinium_polyedra.AAC.1